MVKIALYYSDGSVGEIEYDEGDWTYGGTRVGPFDVLELVKAFINGVPRL